ncbi:MAG: hypothetical protein ACR2GR_06615 [Rhodothermales bacterium]
MPPPNRLAEDGALFLIRPTWATSVLALVALFLVGAGLGVVVYHYTLGYTDLRWFTGYFDLGDEANLPTYFSSGILLLAALLLGWIARAKRQRRAAFARHWLILAFVFLFLSIDEAARLHEFVYQVILHAWGRGSGVFYHIWVVPFLAATLLLGVMYVRFLLNLPARYRHLFIAAALIYVGGAVGFEMVEGVVMEEQGKNNLTYNLFIVVEEAMEMGGVLVFLYALLHYIGTYLTDVRFHVAMPSHRPSSGPPERLYPADVHTSAAMALESIEEPSG